MGVKDALERLKSYSAKQLSRILTAK